jgi:NADP-dependent aldehyde dehydrogenase
LVIGLDGPELDAFVAAAGQALQGTASATMLTPGIHAAFEKGVGALAGHDAVRTVARGRTGDGAHQAVGALFETSAEQFLADSALGNEVFGASAIVVRCRDTAELANVIAGLEGQLTATIQIDPADEPAAADILPLLARRVGRILANGWPTGVEVAHAMVHGGPFPATSDSRTTSVGSKAIERFLRPVCFQNLPAGLIPAAIGDANEWGIARRIDGQREESPK